ncbi:MAG: hypothetical protein WCL71_06875 [Deltaproteobacteria bacterium]
MEFLFLYHSDYTVSEITGFTKFLKISNIVFPINGYINFTGGFFRSGLKPKLIGRRVKLR